MSAENRLRVLGLTLPPPPKPVASYVPAVLSGDLLFVSGMLPMREGVPAWTGKLGRELSVEQGAEAAKLACLNALAVAFNHVDVHHHRVTGLEIGNAFPDARDFFGFEFLYQVHIHAPFSTISKPNDSPVSLDAPLASPGEGLGVRDRAM